MTEGVVEDVWGSDVVGGVGISSDLMGSVVYSISDDKGADVEYVDVLGGGVGWEVGLEGLGAEVMGEEVVTETIDCGGVGHWVSDS